ncbi:alpha/beta hydrolase fold protein [Tricladium varicosporioides]|nr:alpha/beta hydrolase fold protein [Hymenoscyphus varicosporioides]
MDPEPSRIISFPPPFHLRIAYFVSLWSFKAFFSLGLSVSRLFQRRRADFLRPKVKEYPIRSGLKNRIFHPKSSENEKLPLYIDIHGGGWAVADPETDDEFCSFIAQTFNIIVVSVNYHKSPTYKYPHAVEDIAAIVDAIINDQTLYINEKKIAIGGFSAGGNLAFAASQLGILRGRIGSVVGIYPALDFSETLEVKLERRPKNAPSDILKTSANFLDWAYVPQGIDRRDPLLSPCYAKYEDLPQNVYLIGAEFDMLCYEAERMAEALAAESGGERRDMPSVLKGDGWQQGSVRWECARGRDHAFTHISKRGRKERERVKFCQEMYCRIGTWLRKGVWTDDCIP